jgi:hypothetical protein
MNPNEWNSRSGHCKNNPGSQISKIPFKPYGFESPPRNGAPPWMLETLDDSTSLLETSNNSTNPLE